MFDSVAEAVAYAEENGWRNYEIRRTAEGRYEIWPIAT